jgi:hypothetical protein
MTTAVTTTLVSSFSIAANSTANAVDHPKSGKDECRNGKKKRKVRGKVERVLKDHAMKTIGVLNYSSTRSKATRQWAVDCLSGLSTQLYMLGCYVMFVPIAFSSLILFCTNI